MRRRPLLKYSAWSLLGASTGMAAGSNWRMPAEHEPHACTWMSWLQDPRNYDSVTEANAARAALGRLAAAIARFEPVRMLAHPDEHAAARAACGPQVELVPIASDDMWMRDSGPVFLRADDGRLAALDLNFNGWGERQRWRQQDEAVAGSLAAQLGLPHLRTPLTGEGGGLESDGEGTLLLTESCWLHDNRNPGMDKATMTAELKRAFGAEKVIWLPGVANQDITDGHIDGALRVVRPGLIMTSGYPDDDSDWGLALAASRAILARETDARGRNFTLLDIPCATEPANEDRELFTSYANFYLANGAVFTPRFGDMRADALAQRLLGELFPQRRVVSLSVDPIYTAGGGLHCVTQQQPLGRLSGA